jgi:hypothetical protein
MTQIDAFLARLAQEKAAAKTIANYQNERSLFAILGGRSHLHDRVGGGRIGGRLLEGDRGVAEHHVDRRWEVPLALLVARRRLVPQVGDRRVLVGELLFGRRGRLGCRPFDTKIRAHGNDQDGNRCDADAIHR